MPDSRLFGVNNSGRVFSLRTEERAWQELEYLGIEFKKVSAHEMAVWALGGDHQIYVYVYGTTVPIRVCEEAYENQRWRPRDGFSHHLLPTDRPAFSAADGLSERSLPSINLPTLAWNWEGPWTIHTSLNGQHLPTEGWTYALDFPRTYTPTSCWNSCVRRRKWIRYRRYIALNTWSAVPTIHQDHTKEPFIDISVGGGEMMGSEQESLMVWGVTALGKVMVRSNVCFQSPEGDSWLHVETPHQQDVTNISVGRSGMVWALTWDGNILVRQGISRENVLGISWVSISSPPCSPLVTVAVGVRVVWASSRDHTVWFRRGLSKDDTTKSLGTDWIKIGDQKVQQLSVGPNDQVCGVSSVEYSAVMRHGITDEELAGKSWLVIEAPVISCDNRTEESSADSEQEETPIEKSVEGVSMTGSSESGTMERTMRELCAKWEGGEDEMKESVKKEDVTLPENESESEYESATDDSSDEFQSTRDLTDGACASTMKIKIRKKKKRRKKVKTVSSEENFNNNIPVVNNLMNCATISEDNTSVRTSLPYSIIPPKITSRSRHESTSSESSSAALKQATALGLRGGQEMTSVLPLEERIWVGVSGGGCWISPTHWPDWFHGRNNSSFSGNWKCSIQKQLLSLKEKTDELKSSYSEVVCGGSWSICGQCRWLVNGQWYPANVILCLPEPKSKEAPLLKIEFTSSSRKVFSLSVFDILMTRMYLEPPSRCILTLYTHAEPTEPLCLLFSSENVLEEWTDNITSAVWREKLMDTTSNSDFSIWATTQEGGTLVHNCQHIITNYCCDSEKHEQKLPLVNEGKELQFYPLNGGFGENCSVSVTFIVDKDCDRFHLNLQCGDSLYASKALHCNPRVKKKVVVLNSSHKGVWLEEERHKLFGCKPDSANTIMVVNKGDHYGIIINGRAWKSFNHRLNSAAVTHLVIDGGVEVTSVTYTHGAAVKAGHKLWQGVSGHLIRVMSGSMGVTWGLSNDCHAYVYTGASGGHPYYKSLSGLTSSGALYSQSDLVHDYLWENQRWNPLTGFNARGLPTDRPHWTHHSKETQARNKEDVKLPSRHWSWTSEWNIDYHTPGGCDSEGWQHATDFPYSYHSHCYVTDLVRRRRWQRRRRITTVGPWKLLERMPLLYVDVASRQNSDGSVSVWGVSVNGEVLLRLGVTRQCPEGLSWSIVTTDTPVVSICVDMGNPFTTGPQHPEVWAVTREGQAFVRLGVTVNIPSGTHWANVDAPSVPLTKVEVGGGKVWGLDREGNLYLRTETQPLFPEGKEWRLVCGSVGDISVSATGDLWGVIGDKGEIAIRNGSDWNKLPGYNWKSLCVKMFSRPS